MNKTICIVNCPENSIEIKGSIFYADTEFANMTRGELLEEMSHMQRAAIVFIYFNDDLLNDRHAIKQLIPGMGATVVIAMVSSTHISMGITALGMGASDFMILPADGTTFDIYVKRAMDKICIQKELLFKNEYYKSRYSQSEKKYKQLFNEVPCFIFTLNKDYLITDSNRKFNEYFGNHIGEYCFGICKNRDDPCRICPVQLTYEDGENHALESEIISSDGVKHIVLSWTAPIRDSAGNINKVLVMLTDITEVRRLEDHLSSLGVMIGSISHGIKGLLTSLDSGMYLINTGFKKGDMTRISEGLEISNQITERIKKLVLDILYYTKTRRPVWQKVSARGFIDEVMMPIIPAAGQSDIKLQLNVQCETHDDYFEIDEKSLQSAFINILENSIDACVASGTARNCTILFHCRIKADKIVFLIKDDGKGMDAMTLKNIFTIFFSSKGKQGTGLGLYITNKVIEQHSGEIKVRSSLDTGTKFLIKMPRIIPRTAKKKH
ncbi:ATP-binding protein [Desulfocicer vacuolatum]|nr:PAS domain-containing sensor histidine kinase [Desulfocicer vacuolatum]